MTTNLRPLADLVLVQYEDTSNRKSPSGLITVTGDPKREPRNASVIAVGAGRILDNGTRVRPEIEPGQTVLVQAYVGTDVDLDGVKYGLVREGEILAVFGPKGA